MIREGNEGFEVILLQARLRKLGYDIGSIDGKFGSKTLEEARRFQYDNRLKIDGLVGRVTSGKLTELTKFAWLFYFLHCSATVEGRDIGGDWIRKVHAKWSRTGYPDIIRLSGEVESLRPFNTDELVQEDEFTFGVKSKTLLNRNSIHLAYMGGVDKYNVPKDTRTEGQKKSMRILIEHSLLRNPDLIIVGHNQVQKKACPSFDVPTYLRSIGVKERNIALWPNDYRI